MVDLLQRCYCDCIWNCVFHKWCVEPLSSSMVVCIEMRASGRQPGLNEVIWMGSSWGGEWGLYRVLEHKPRAGCIGKKQEDSCLQTRTWPLIKTKATRRNRILLLTSLRQWCFLEHLTPPETEVVPLFRSLKIRVWFWNQWTGERASEVTDNVEWGALASLKGHLTFMCRIQCRGWCFCTLQPEWGTRVMEEWLPCSTLVGTWLDCVDVLVFCGG